MTSRDFCYWLQGLFELGTSVNTLDQKQTESIKRHLAMVFLHEIDPSAGDAKEQANLNKAHETPGSPPKIGGVGPGGTVFRC